MFFLFFFRVLSEAVFLQVQAVLLLLGGREMSNAEPVSSGSSQQKSRVLIPLSLFVGDIYCGFVFCSR